MHACGFWLPANCTCNENSHRKLLLAEIDGITAVTKQLRRDTVTAHCAMRTACFVTWALASSR